MGTLLEILLKSFMIMLSTMGEECLNRESVYAFEKDFHAVMHVWFFLAQCSTLMVYAMRFMMQ